MNEQIKKLLVECYNPYSDFDYEKFAKLIIRECIGTVENLSPGYDDYRNQIEDAFRRDCVEEIKKHFGVE
jgi:hypothetical protein